MTRGGPFAGAMTNPNDRSLNFKGSTKRLLSRMSPDRLGLVAVLVLVVASIALSVIGPKILGHATDLIFGGIISRQLPGGITAQEAIDATRASGNNRLADLMSGMTLNPGHGIDFDAVGRTLALVLLAYVASSILMWLQGRILNAVVQRTMYQLRADVEAKLHRLPLSYFDSAPRGETLSRVTNDIDNITQTLGQTLTQLLTSILTVVGVLVMMVYISPLLAVIALIAVPLSIVVTAFVGKRSQKLFIAQWSHTGKLNAHIEETYSGHSLVKTFGHQKEAEADFAERNQQLYEASFGAQFISGLIMPIMMFIGNVSYVAIAVVGGLQVASGATSLGNVQAFIQYSRQFTQPLTQVASMMNLLQSGIASAERVFELLDAPEQEPDVRRDTALADRGRVEFENVVFSYDVDKPLIEDLSLIAEPGHTIAIVGPTGAGKTTLVNLIMRFYERLGGAITLDGVDITAMSRDQLRSRVGMVLQDTWLFHGTIYDNIAYGRPTASEEEVLDAARATFVDRFVHSLPDGYQTVIDEEGGNISAGEKQLITIARAFLARPTLLILDEATSSVDTRTELLVQKAMAALRAERTSFIIAHRLSTIRDADLILVMSEGSIVEQGTHEELMEREGTYFALQNA